MEQFQTNPEALHFLEKIRSELPEVKNQLVLLNSIAFTLQNDKVTGDSRTADLVILPHDIKPDKILLLYRFLHVL